MGGNGERRNTYAVIIFSHSSYVDVWPVLFDSYAEYFKSQNIDFFITSDERNDVERLANVDFQHLYYDPNASWTEAFFECVKDLQYEKYLFSFDDLILRRPVRMDALRDALEQQQFDYLKVICSHVRVKDRLFRSGDYFEVNHNDSYRGSLVFTVLDQRILDHITQQRSLARLTAWQYERQVNRVLSDSFKYGCVRHNVFSFENLIIKGSVNPLSRLRLRWLCNLTYDGNRGDMNIVATANYYLKLFVFTVIKYLTPPGWFAKFRKMKRSLMRAFGNP